MTHLTLKANQALRDARTREGLTLRELAYFAGCAHTTISRLEAGDLDVSPGLKAKIARALRTPVSELWVQEASE